MKWIGLWLLLTFPLWATCTPEAEALYKQLNSTTNIKTKITLLEQSLALCPSYEIETTLWIAKAEQSQELDTKITYYRNALAPLSFIEDEAFVVQEQNRINQIISELYQTANELRSQEYQDKVQTQQKVKEPSPIGYLIITIIVLLFIWWSFRKS